MGEQLIVGRIPCPFASAMTLCRPTPYRRLPSRNPIVRCADAQPRCHPDPSHPPPTSVSNDICNSKLIGAPAATTFISTVRAAAHARLGPSGNPHSRVRKPAQRYMKAEEILIPTRRMILRAPIESNVEMRAFLGVVEGHPPACLLAGRLAFPVSHNYGGMP